MKLHISKLLGVWAIAIGLLLGQSLLAKDSSQIAGIKKTLAGFSALELPPRSASLVAQAADKERESVTIAVVHAAIGLNPSAAPAIVGAIAKGTPAMAPVAAVTAVSLQSKRANLIIRAAAAGAPDQAGKIVSALIKEYPRQYTVWAVAASQGAPSAGKAILNAVAEFVPALQSSISKAIADSSTTDAPLPVAAILDQSLGQMHTVGASTQRPAVQGPPTQGPPYTPPPASPVEINTSQTHPETAGTRYSSP